MKTRRHQINDKIGIYNTDTNNISDRDTLASLQYVGDSSVILPAALYDEQMITVSERKGYNATVTAAGGKTIGGLASVIINKKATTFMWDVETDEWYVVHGDLPAARTSIDLTANNLKYTDELGNETNIDLTFYLDNTNLAYLVNGTVDPETGIATFTRDDATSFTVDFSGFFADHHTHDNKSELDLFATGDKAALDDAATKAHTHTNKSELDNFQAGDRANLAQNTIDRHTHANKSALDEFASGDKTKIDEAHSDRHTHPNKDELDLFETGDKQRLDDIPDHWVGTQAEYDALGSYDPDTVYYIKEV